MLNFIKLKQLKNHRKLSEEEYKEFLEEVLYEQKFEISQSRREELGKYIRKLREDNNLSVIQLSDLTSIAISDIHKIEHGTLGVINPFKLKKLAQTLGVDYKELYRMVKYLED